ncbi:unnamed protein product [Onchocerca ochengi]|uniref:Pecanex-like protein n=1 Tax=Onchocerca ochengi TaxID=42157 RepID=A0A182EDT2_ONCOC|nr:unnamed protein product [Onchocerca ochengi]
MSMLPMKNLSGSLPVLFIEARLQGPPEIVLSQMGISIDASDYNIALLIRTSGVLLVASVGSYMMYRVCTRLLGRNFIWTILEQARFDLLSRDETYLLSSRMSYVVNNEYDSCYLKELTDDEDEKTDCDSRILSTDHLRREKQFYEGSFCGSSKNRLEITSKHRKHSISLASQSSSNTEFTASDKSASLHLLWDDPQWDEEIDFSFYGDIVHRGHHSVPSNVSDMTEFRAAKGLFEESDNCCKMSKDDQRSYENSSREERSIDFETNDFIQKNCMIDSKHLYHITTGFITRTNSMSVSSERSSQSFLSLRQRLIANAPSDGLLELVQSSTTTTPIISADHLITSMTDSGISRGTISTCNLQSSMRSTDAKCTFGAEIFSSEDETLDMMVPQTSTKNRNSIIGRNNLNLIDEDRNSRATSAQSMEWFEDNYYPFVTNQELEKSLETEIDDNPLAACFSGSKHNQKCSSSSESRRKHLYSVTRDLMTWARDHFAPKSPQLKV